MFSNTGFLQESLIRICSSGIVLTFPIMMLNLWHPGQAVISWWLKHKSIFLVSLVFTHLNCIELNKVLLEKMYQCIISNI